MKRTTKLSLALLAATAIGAAIAAPVLAHGPQGNGWMQGGQHTPGVMMGAQGGPGMMGQGGPGGMAGMMGGGMMGNPDMMQQMMQMHQQMGGMGMMGDLFADFDTDGDGTVTPEEAHSGMQAALEQHDTDGDGALSLDEFQALHSETIQSRMSARFKALDADGDGKVTADEITAPADRMAQMQSMWGLADDATDDTDTTTDENN